MHNVDSIIAFLSLRQLSPIQSLDEENVNLEELSSITGLAGFENR